MFSIVPILVGIIFVIVIGVILISVLRGVGQWNKNNHSPKIIVKAKVVTKRTSIHGGGETRAYTNYFVTFEVQSGDRMELEVKDHEFGMLVEGDVGELTFQGTRYLGFTRE